MRMLSVEPLATISNNTFGAKASAQLFFDLWKISRSFLNRAKLHNTSVTAPRFAGEKLEVHCYQPELALEHSALNLPSHPVRKQLLREAGLQWP